jgi:lipopolysaccharide export system permease protein
MALAAIFAVLMGFLSLYVVPWSETRTEIIYKQAKQRNTLESLSAGRFKELTKGEGVVYVQDYDSEALRMNKVFMQDRVRHKNSVDDSIITATSGYRMTDKHTGDQFLVLENGFRFEQLGKSDRTAIIRFEKHGVRVEQDTKDTKVDLQQHAMSSGELWKRGTGADHAELQWRISTAILIVVLAMLGIPLSRSAPRQGRASRLALALLIYIIYTNLLNVSRAWLNHGTISVWIGMWWVHLLGVILALALFVRWKHLLLRFWHEHGH